MAYTPRFGLTTFGSGVPGSFADDASKYTLGDRALIDALLSALENHDHTAAATALADPGGAPACTLQPDVNAGLISGDWYYRLAYVDRWGLRTGPSNEVKVTIPAGPTAPGTAPSLAPATGGTLGSGQYTYALTVYVSSPTMSSLIGPASRATLTGSNHSMTISMPALPSGATGWTIWRQGPLDGQLRAIQDITGATTSFTDTGLACDCNRTPPQQNLTGTGYKVTATLPASDIGPVLPVSVQVQTSDGGTLGPGTYTYRLQPCFHDNVAGTFKYGGVTTVVATTTALTSTVTLSVRWDQQVPYDPPTPTHYDTTMKVFGRGPTSGLLMSVPIVQGITTITDTGSGSPSGTMPSAVSWTGPRAGIAGWELHRTQVSGNTTVFSLVERVTTTETEFGGMLVSSVVDMGTAPIASTVPTRSSTFDPPPAVNLASVPLGSFAYTPTDSHSPVAGPNAASVVTQLEGLARVTPVLYTMQAGTAAFVGTTRYYHTGPWRLKSVRVSSSVATTSTIDVKVNGTSVFVSGAQSVGGPGLTTTATPSSTIRAVTDYLTVDLVSGTVPGGTSLLIHLDVEDCKP